jgi:hypothetical protein
MCMLEDCRNLITCEFVYEVDELIMLSLCLYFRRKRPKRRKKWSLKKKKNLKSVYSLVLLLLF